MQVGEDGDEGEEEGGPKTEVMLLLALLLDGFYGFFSLSDAMFFFHCRMLCLFHCLMLCLLQI